MKKEFDNFIKVKIQPFLKSNGYKKKNFNFIKEVNNLFYLINFQKSNGSNWEYIPFYINYGLYSKDLSKLSEFHNENNFTIWDCQIWNRILPPVPEKDFTFYSETDEEYLSNFLIEEFVNKTIPFFEKFKTDNDIIEYNLENLNYIDKEDIFLKYLLKYQNINKVRNYLYNKSKSWEQANEDDKVRFQRRKDNFYNKILKEYNLNFDDLLKNYS